MDLNDLTNNQAIMYNDIIMSFNMHGRDKVRPKGHLRLGQAFYAYGYDMGIFKGSYPELFYCEDNKKAQEMIVTCVCDYVKEKV